jgi:hypothetical protein
VAGSFEVVTLLAQCICFARGNLNPKRSTYAQVWTLLWYQILFVISCVSLAPFVIDDWIHYGMPARTAVAWSVTCMMIVTASM